MSDYLYPAFDVPAITPPKSEANTGKYLPSALFDFVNGDFIMDGANRLVECDGKTAWEQWCVKTVCTQRYACMSYNSDAGIEAEEILSTQDRSAAESLAERTITEALMADPYGRTQCVRNFTFEWGTDWLQITFDAVGMGGEPSRLTVKLRGDMFDWK